MREKCSGFPMFRRLLATLFVTSMAICALPAIAQQARPPDIPVVRRTPFPRLSPSARPSLPPCTYGQGGLPAGYPSQYASVTPPPYIPTAPPGAWSDPSGAADATAQGTILAQQQGLLNPQPWSSAPPCAPPPLTGDLLHRIWLAANAFRFQSTAWPGTQCQDPVPPDHLGNCACAAAIQRVVFNATGAMIGSYSVDDWILAMLSGRYGGGPVSQVMAHAGAIIIWKKHIGVCSDGCTETLSNSSSKSRFAPYIGGSIWEGEAPAYIWEPQHIP